jgi:hypothetical protein
MTPEEVFEDWKSGLKTPDDSSFYYHKSLDRIILGLAIFVLTPQPNLAKLGKAESLKILHLQVPDLVTAWIDEDDETFESMFKRVMMVADNYMVAGGALARKNPAKGKVIIPILEFYAAATASAGDMTPALAEELLDDLSTDGDKIYSDKIASFGNRMMLLVKKYGIDIPLDKMCEVNGW